VAASRAADDRRRITLRASEATSEVASRSSLPLRSRAVPPHLYYAAFALFAALVWAISTRAQRSSKNATSSMRAGEVARTLGMTWIKGDPDFHLFADAPSRGIAGALLSGTPLPYAGPATDILARGVLDGRMTELTFFAKLNAGIRIGGLMGREIEVVRQCRLAIAPQTPVGEFELVLRNPQPGAEAERVFPGLPAVLFGDGRLDARYQLFTGSPDLARSLVRGLSVLDDQTYVHVIGGEGRVAMSFTLGATYLFAGAPQVFLQKLDALARALETSRTTA
jgi:hypothetical protein